MTPNLASIALAACLKPPKLRRVESLRTHRTHRTHVKSPTCPDAQKRGASDRYSLPMQDAKPRLFISWSLDLSRAVAGALKEWLSTVFTEVDVFMSDEDIEIGTAPMDRIRNELDASSCGIIVLTQANQHRPWVNFEAGNLFRNFDSKGNRLVPLLVDFRRKTDIEGPLARFMQAALLNEADAMGMVRSLCTAFNLEPTRKLSIAERFWPDFADAVEVAKGAPSSAMSERTAEEKIDEILEIARALGSQAPQTDNSLGFQLADMRQQLDRIQFVLNAKLQQSDQAEGLLQVVLSDFNQPPLQVAINQQSTIQNVLDEVYFAIASDVDAFTYGVSWILETSGNGVLRTTGGRGRRRGSDDRPALATWDLHEHAVLIARRIK